MKLGGGAGKLGGIGVTTPTKTTSSPSALPPRHHVNVLGQLLKYIPQGSSTRPPGSMGWIPPQSLQVRLMVCTGLERWELGSEVARVIPPSYWLPVREAAGRFYLGHAVALCGSGDVSGARAAVGALAVVWSEGRALVVDSKRLHGRAGMSAGVHGSLTKI